MSNHSGLLISGHDNSVFWAFALHSRLVVILKLLTMNKLNICNLK